jgi:hypothetical protein
MDSSSIANEMSRQTANGTLQLLLDFILKLMPSLVALGSAGIAWYALQNARKLKEADLEDANRQRKFQVSLNISQKALGIMGHSYHLINEVNRALARTSENPVINQAILDTVFSARKYWEENVFYLPLKARKIMIPMTQKIFASMSGTNRSHWADLAQADLRTAFVELEVAFRDLMAEYNIFDKLGTESTAKE